jgi:hypothetical protein
MNCCIPVSVGELCDKYTILQIKTQKITDIEKLDKVNTELKMLKPLLELYNVSNVLMENLKVINEELWNIEDTIRNKEYLKQFDSEFIEIARSVYITNDKRFKVKSDINQLYNSNICEVKSYTEYL